MDKRRVKVRIYSRTIHAVAFPLLPGTCIPATVRCFWTAQCPLALQQLRKTQLMPVWVSDVEKPLTPRSVARLFRTQP